MSLMICQRCGKPRLTAAPRCPHCGAPSHTGEQDEESDGSPASLACLILMVAFALVLILLPVLLIGGILFR